MNDRESICQAEYAVDFLMIIKMEICKAPTLWLKALNKHIEMENVISNKKEKEKKEKRKRNLVGIIG